MRIRYTVTTKTRRCRHCGAILEQETSGEETPFLASFGCLLFPVLIPYWLIHSFGFDYPTIPKIGPPVAKCHRCFNPYFTEMCEVSALKGEALLNYRFRIWFYVCYVLGTILTIDILYLLIGGQPILSIGGLVALISLVGVIAIILTYRLKLADIQSATVKNKVTTVPAVETKQQSTQNECLYCRKCGKKIPADSLFCDKCGTEVVK